MRMCRIQIGKPVMNIHSVRVVIQCNIEEDLCLPCKCDLDLPQEDALSECCDFDMTYSWTNQEQWTTWISVYHQCRYELCLWPWFIFQWHRQCWWIIKFDKEMLMLINQHKSRTNILLGLFNNAFGHWIDGLISKNKQNDILYTSKSFIFEEIEKIKTKTNSFSLININYIMSIVLFPCILESCIFLAVSDRNAFLILLTAHAGITFLLPLPK